MAAKDHKEHKGESLKADLAGSSLFLLFSFLLAGRLFRLHHCVVMKTATVRDLRNRYSTVLRWVSGGEEVLIMFTAWLESPGPLVRDCLPWKREDSLLRRGSTG